MAIDSPELRERLRKSSETTGELTLLRSDRAMTDCRPVSLISTQTVGALSDEGAGCWIKDGFARTYMSISSPPPYQRKMRSLAAE